MHLFSINRTKFFLSLNGKTGQEALNKNRTSGLLDADNIPARSYARCQSVFNARRLVPNLLRLDPYTTLEHRNVIRNILRIFTRIFSA